MFYVLRYRRFPIKRPLALCVALPPVFNQTPRAGLPQFNKDCFRYRCWFSPPLDESNQTPLAGFRNSTKIVFATSGFKRDIKKTMFAATQ
jgi:hypothetical protein